MKYTSTSRTVCLLFHALIAAAFGAMGIWFGFFVVPQYLGSNPRQFYPGGVFDSAGPFLLWFELAVLGLSMMVVSLLGLASAVKALRNPRDDEAVVRSFSAFLCEGWMMAVFFLLQGLLLWDLTANGNIVFVVVMSLLIAIVLMIATNIPMVKIFDQRDQTPLLVDFIGCGALVLGIIAAESAFALFGAMTLATQKTQVFTLLATILIPSAIASVLALLAWLRLRRGAGGSGLKVVACLLAASVIVAGAGLVVYGTLDIVAGAEKAVHLYAKNVGASEGNTFDLGFGIMAIALGCLMAIGGIIAAALTASKRQPAAA